MTSPPAADGATATTSCRACEREVPAAAFCDYCGAQLFAPRGDGLGRFRLSA